MAIYKFDPGFGDFKQASEKAKEISIEKDMLVEFEFNGINCVVHSTTNLEWLFRDYLNAWLMVWKTVGPFCVEKYSPEIEKQIKEKKEAQDRQREKEQQEYNDKMKLKAEGINKKLGNIEIELSDPDGWKKCVEVNDDPYGAAAVRYSEQWARLMQYEFSKGKKIADCAEATSSEADTEGITGFMYGCAVSMLAEYWKHGEALRMWHNLKTQIGTEGEAANESGGTLNPALLTVK